MPTAYVLYIYYTLIHKKSQYFCPPKPVYAPLGAILPPLRIHALEFKKTAGTCVLICNYIEMHVCVDEYSCVCIFQLRKSLHTIFIIIILTILAVLLLCSVQVVCLVFYLI